MSIGDGIYQAAWVIGVAAIIITALILHNRENP